MSLFKLKNLWAQTYNEEMDSNHLCVGSIDGITAVGLTNFSGTVRIYQLLPNAPVQANLIYQHTFDTPAITIQFIEHPELGKKNSLGILLFRKLVYLNLRKNQQTGSYEPNQVHVIVQPGFSLGINPPIVMTLNSSIQYLNPIAIQQIKVSDPIYPFAQTVYGITSGLYYADGEELVFFMNSVEQWRVIVGPMRHIEAMEDIAVVIGDNALWEVSEARINKTKILEDDVSSATVVRKGLQQYNILVGNFSHQVLVYSHNYTLLWAVKTEEVPLKLCLIQSKQFKGALCILGDNGTVSLSFLGSDLPEHNIEPLKDQIQISEVDSEIKRYTDELKNKDGSQGTSEKQHTTVGSQQLPIQLTLKARTPKFVESHVEDQEKYLCKDGKVWCCEVQLVMIPDKDPIFNVKCSIDVPSNLQSANSEHFFSSVRGRQAIVFTLYCSAEKFPYLNQAFVTVRFENADKKKGLQVTKRGVPLPMDFQCSLKSLQLEDKPSNKIVLKGSKQLPSLSKLFHQYQRDLQESKNATFELANGVLCSIGYNKGNTKVKLQSNFFSGLCFLYVLYWTRFQKIKEKTKQDNELAADIPLQELFGIMKDHYEQRKIVKEQFIVLDKKSQEFRSTQKKLLIKMKEKVSSINHIDKLLEYTYRSLMREADKYESIREEMEVINHNMEVSLTFVTEMLFMKCGASQRCREKVLGIVGYEKESPAFGWEEKVMSSSGFYLGKKYQYEMDKHTFDQVYKIVVWVISKINSGEWN